MQIRQVLGRNRVGTSPTQTNQTETGHLGMRRITITGLAEGTSQVSGANRAEINPEATSRGRVFRLQIRRTQISQVLGRNRMETSREETGRREDRRMETSRTQINQMETGHSGMPQITTTGRAEGTNQVLGANPVEISPAEIDLLKTRSRQQ
jgi:hypothetical protein